MLFNFDHCQQFISGQRCWRVWIDGEGMSRPKDVASIESEPDSRCPGLQSRAQGRSGNSIFRLYPCPEGSDLEALANTATQ
jgi:hypothetical protein